jgi:hypothetical protein
MQTYLAIRAVASETAKLAMALSAILVPLFLVAFAIERLGGDAASPAFSVVSLLKGVWF